MEFEGKRPSASSENENAPFSIYVHFYFLSLLGDFAYLLIKTKFSLCRFSSMQTETTTQKAKDWFREQGWTAFPFQEAAWEAYLAGKSGLVNAPTGSRKTYSLIIPILIECLQIYSWV